MSTTPQANPYDTMLQTYRKWGQPVSSAFARAALDKSGLVAGSSVLDACAGTGSLAVNAAQDGHRVRAIDSSSGMLGIAAERLAPFPGCGAEQMDVTAMTFADATFDAAFSVLGATLLGDRVPAVLRELVRVTRPGGVVGVVHWASTWGSPIFALMARAVQRLDDPEAGALFPPVPEKYVDPAGLEAALSLAGCVDVSVSAFEVAIPLPPPERAFDELDAMYVNYPQYRALTDQQRHRLRGAFADVVRESSSDDGRGPDAACHIAIGVVPR